MEIVGQPEDLRVQRTRKVLQQALFELTVERGYAAVTVRDIATRAMVNRSTFYRHYLDKEDLLSQYLEQLQSDIAQAAADAEALAATASTPERVPGGLLLLVRHVQEHGAFYRVMLGQHGDPLFTNRFRQLSERRYRSLVARYGEVANPQAPPLDMSLQYISYAGIGAILWWLEQRQPCSAEQLAIWLSQLSMTTASLTIAQLKPLGQPDRTM